MNSWSSAESGPLSSMPAGPPARRGGSRLDGQRREPAACSRSTSKPPAGWPPCCSRSQRSFDAVLVVVRLELHQHLEDRGGLVEAARREVGLDHLRVGLRHQRVVARLAVELDQLGQAADVGGVALDDLLEDRGAAVDLAALHELVHGRQDLLEGLVVAPLGEVHLPELQARVLVRGVSLEQGLEDRRGRRRAASSRGRPPRAGATPRGRRGRPAAPPRGARSRGRSPSGRGGRGPRPRAGAGCAAPSAGPSR